MQYHNHSFLNRLLILVQKQKKVNFIICYRITNCCRIFVLCLQLFTLVLYLTNYSDNIYLILWVLLNNFIDARQFLGIHLKSHVFLFYKLRILIKYYLELSLFTLFYLSSSKKVILSYLHHLSCLLN